MVTMSAFEVLGPVMVGPSSSHTAGALRIALVARSLAPQPLESVDFLLYNSFSRTHAGHGTDRALVAGILGLAPDDVRVRRSFELAGEAGLNFAIIEQGEDETLHPNTVEIRMRIRGGKEISVMGESLGGGRIRLSSIDGVPVDIAGEMPTVFVAHEDRPGVLAALTAVLSGAGVNIATMRTFRHERGGAAYTVFEVDEAVDQELIELLRQVPHVGFASQVDVPGAGPAIGDADEDAPYAFATGADLVALSEKNDLSIGELMRGRELGIAAAQGLAGSEVDAMLDRVLQVMRDETVEAISHPKRSLGGMIGGEALRVSMSGKTPVCDALMGATATRGIAMAMATLERSATMGVIVAAPTAGSSGVVPGSILAVAESVGADEALVKKALWNASAIGAIISTNATVAGAEGGCQAEVGAATAMASSALVEMLGGSASQCLDAAALAIANTLGLVCDPVRGMVEYPCQARNAMGVSVAMCSAQLALAGITSLVPFDEAVVAMSEVGHALPASLRETAEGGLAATPTAQAFSCDGACDGCIGCA